MNISRLIICAVCAGCLAPGVAWAQKGLEIAPAPRSRTPTAPPKPPSPEEELLAQIRQEAVLYWRGGALTYAQKADFGHLWEDVESRKTASGFPPLDDLQATLNKIKSLATPQQRERCAARVAELDIIPSRRACSIFTMVVPDELAARRDEAFRTYHPQLVKERAETSEFFDGVRREIAGRYGLDPDSPQAALTSLPLDLAQEYKARTLVASLERAPYHGHEFDRRWLNDPALSTEKREELANRILARTLRSRLRRGPFCDSLVAVRLNAEQRAKVEAAWKTACERLYNDSLAGKVEMADHKPLQARLAEEGARHRAASEHQQRVQTPLSNQRSLAPECGPAGRSD